MIGEIIGGRYRVLERLGEGGHGFVHRAEDLELRAPVAIKIMRPQDMGQGELERFEREAELARRLSHPNVARLLAWGVHETGVEEDVPFLVFELFEGKPLSDILRASGPMPAGRVARLAIQVLHGLAEAHTVGIVHRDIKPANIMVAERGAQGDVVKIVDFGVAKSLRSNTLVITKQGEVPGTPSYMSPEHIEDRPVAPSTDLFCLGIVLAELLSGTKVYPGSIVDICIDLLSQDPVPLAPAVRATSLGTIIERATQKRMELRYQTAGEMLRDLELALTGRAVVPTSSPPYPAQQAVYVPTSSPPYPGQQAVYVPTSSPPFRQTFPPTSQPASHSPSLPPSLSLAPSLPRTVPPAGSRTALKLALGGVAALLLCALVIAVILLVRQ